MKTKITGRVYVVRNDIDTDAIIPACYMTTMDRATLARHAMEGLNPSHYDVPFLNSDGSCDYKIILAGRNFGCGSSREHAPIALAGAGVEAVVAQTFARIYYRNSVNGGIILPLESSLDLTGDTFFEIGDEAEINLEGIPTITNLSDTRGKRTYPLRQFGPVKDIIEAGGLTAYNKRRLGIV